MISGPIDIFLCMFTAYTELTVASFDWHSKEDNRMLTISPTGSVKDVHIFERIAVVRFLSY